LMVTLIMEKIQSCQDLCRFSRSGSDFLDIRSHRAGPGDCYFWSTHAGAELDLLVFEAGRRIGYEIKHTDTPRMTRSLRIAQTDLKIDDLYVVYPGSEQFPLDDRVHAAGLQVLVLE
jgi:uncharacterized protein